LPLWRIGGVAVRVHATIRGMSHDPTVTAAVVTVVGTVVGAGSVAIVSFFTTAWSTRRTLESGERSTHVAFESSSEAAKQAARNERAHRLWERRTEVYKRLIAHTSAVQERRENRVHMLSNDKLRTVGWVLELGDIEDWRALNADLVVYGSDLVHKAAILFTILHQQAAWSLEHTKRGSGYKDTLTKLEEAREQTREIVRLVRAETQALD